MDIEIFTLCDFAEAYAGKLFIIGAFDTIFAQKLPAIHPLCTVATRIRYRPGDNGNVAVQLRITSPDNDNVLPPFRGSLNLPLKPGAESMSAHFIMNFQGLQFKTYGRHSITLSIHGQDLRTLPLFVAKIPEPKSETEGI